MHLAVIPRKPYVKMDLEPLTEGIYNTLKDLVTAVKQACCASGICGGQMPLKEISEEQFNSKLSRKFNTVRYLGL